MNGAEIDLMAARLISTPTGVSLFMLGREVHENPPWASDPAHKSGPGTVVEQLRRLKADLVRLESGWIPSETDLSSAPLLEDWGVHFDPSERLWRVVGNFHGTDVQLSAWGIGGGDQVATMQVLAVDGDFRWVRDRAAFYRLGEPA